MQTTTYGRKWRAPPMPLLPHDSAKGHIKRTYRTMPPLLRLDSSGEVSSVDRGSFKEVVQNPNPTDLGNVAKPFRSRCNMRNWVTDRLFNFNTVSNGNSLQKGLWKNNLESIENSLADDSQFSTFSREPITSASNMSRVPYMNPNGKWLPQCGFNGWYYVNGPSSFNYPQGSYGLFPCHQFKNMYDMPCQTYPVSNDFGGVSGYRSQFQSETMSCPFPVFGPREMENPTNQWGKCRKMGRQHEKTNNWQCGHRQNRHTDRRDRKQKTSCESMAKANSENLEINSSAIKYNQNQCTKLDTPEELGQLPSPVNHLSACNTAIAEKSGIFKTEDLETDGSFISSKCRDPDENDKQTQKQSETKPDNDSNLPHKQQQFQNKVARQLENMDENKKSFSDCVNRVDGIKGGNYDSSFKGSDKAVNGTSSAGNFNVLFVRKNVKKGRPSSKKQRKRKRQKAKNSGDGEPVVITVEESSYGDADFVCTETDAGGTNNEKHLECHIKNADGKQFGCNSISFILGLQPEDTSPQPCGSPNTNFMTFTFSDEEDDDSFDDEVDIGADFSQCDLYNFLPKCQGANNPLNFKVHISSVPSTDSNDSEKELDAINMSWNIQFSIRDVDHQKTKTTKKKQVHFAKEKNLATIHPMIAWSYAYKASRKGPWEGFARDRERFRRRIVDTEMLLQPVFHPTKRCLMYNMYYKPTAEES